LDDEPVEMPSNLRLDKFTSKLDNLISGAERFELSFLPCERCVFPIGRWPQKRRIDGQNRTVATAYNAVNLFQSTGTRICTRPKQPISHMDAWRFELLFRGAKRSVQPLH